MHFSYQEAFNSKSLDGYETLLADGLLGEATLFMRAAQVEALWSVLDPILQPWTDRSPGDFPNNSSGDWEPQVSDTLIEKDGRSWLQPPNRQGKEGKQ